MKTKLLKEVRRDAKFTYKIIRDINVYRILHYNGITGYDKFREFIKREDAIEYLNKIRRDFIILKINKKRDKAINKQLIKL